MGTRICIPHESDLYAEAVTELVESEFSQTEKNPNHKEFSRAKSGGV